MLKVYDNEENFDDIISQDSWIVDFSAIWCGPCRMLEPVLDELSKKYNILKIDIDKSSELVERFSIMSVPTLILFKSGVEKNKIIGFHTSEEIIEKFK